MTEAQHQKKIFDWSKQPGIRAAYPEIKLLYHVPNEGARNEVAGHYLKQQGLKRGVPDLCLPVARGRYHGLYIELKSETGTTSDDQDWWIEQLQAQCYCCGVARGYKQACDMLVWYLNGAVAR